MLVSAVRITGAFPPCSNVKVTPGAILRLISQPICAAPINEM